MWLDGELEGLPERFYPIRFVIVESPYAGDTVSNIEYAQRACKDCISRGEIPLASHLYWPQFLDDSSPFERELGIELGYYTWDDASLVVFYLDKGWSPGMLRARRRAEELDLNQEIRYMDLTE